MRFLDRNILAFIGLSVVLGVLANVLVRGIHDFGDNAALGVFALSVAALALFAPVWFKGPLPKDLVDLWYYLLVMCSVVSLYLYNTVERERLQVSLAAREAKARMESLSARQALLRKMVAQPDALLAEFRQRATAALEVNEYMRKQQCGCADPIGTCAGAPAFDTGIPQEPSAKAARDAQRTAAALVCIELLKPETDAPWKALAEAKSLDALAARDWSDLDPGRSHSFADTDQSLAEVVSTLARGHHDAKLLLRLGEQLAIDELAEQKAIDESQARYKKLAGLDAKPELGSSSFVGLLWPYIVIVLLGMKVARVRYLGSA